MSLSRNGSIFSRYDCISNSQIMDLKQHKLYPSSTKNYDQISGYFLSLSKMQAPDYGSAQLLNNVALKNKIKEKRNQKSINNDSMLNKFVTKVDKKLKQRPLKKKRNFLLMKYQLKSNHILQLLNLNYNHILLQVLQSRSQTQNKRNEIYYLSKLQKAFDTDGSEYFSHSITNIFIKPIKDQIVDSLLQIIMTIINLINYQRQFTLFFNLNETLVHFMKHSRFLVILFQNLMQLNIKLLELELIIYLKQKKCKEISLLILKQSFLMLHIVVIRFVMIQILIQQLLVINYFEIVEPQLILLYILKIQHYFIIILINNQVKLPQLTMHPILQHDKQTLEYQYYDFMIIKMIENYQIQRDI